MIFILQHKTNDVGLIHSIFLKKTLLTLIGNKKGKALALPFLV